MHNYLRAISTVFCITVVGMETFHSKFVMCVIFLFFNIFETMRGIVD